MKVKAKKKAVSMRFNSESWDLLNVYGQKYNMNRTEVLEYLAEQWIEDQKNKADEDEN